MKHGTRLKVSTPLRMRIIVWCLLSVSLSPSAAVNAFQAGPAQLEVEPYIKGGAIAWDQLSGVGGLKSMVGLGLNSVATFGRVGTGFNFEKWWLAERLDDDKGIIPNGGHRVFADARYTFAPAEELRLYPFAGFGYEHWSREDAVGSWHSINFPYAAIGGGADYGSGFFKVGVLMPFAATADTGPDPKSRVGLLLMADSGYSASLQGYSSDRWALKTLTQRWFRQE